MRKHLKKQIRLDMLKKPCMDKLRTVRIEGAHEPTDKDEDEEEILHDVQVANLEDEDCGLGAVTEPLEVIMFMSGYIVHTV
jgi:hypothetical protein